MRSLATGKDATAGTPLAGTARGQAHRIAEGVEDIIASGNLHRTPAIFVTGRSDGIFPPNLASRAYFGLNHVVEGSLSPLHYFEVTNAQHLDSINALPGFDTIYIPLHRYFIQAMDLLYEHLRHGRALPPNRKEYNYVAHRSCFHQSNDVRLTAQLAPVLCQSCDLPACR